MGMYKVFDGTNWVDPCECDVRIRTSDDAWKLLAPRDCVTKYWDGQKWCPLNCPQDPGITDKTEINIWFDTSGSMGSTQNPLLKMKEEFLEACLLPVYNNDINLYNTRVKFINESNERTLLQLGVGRNFNYPSVITPNCLSVLYPPWCSSPQFPAWVDRPIDLSVNKVINLVFSDENHPNYYGPKSGPFDPNVQTPTYLEDIAYMRNNVQNAPYTIQGTLFRVESKKQTESQTMRDFVEAVFNDTGLYTPPLNLSDLSANFNAKLDIKEGFYINLAYNNKLASEGVDWIPGTYVCDVTASGGPGAGMTAEVVAEVVTDGIGAMTLLPAGGTGYPPNQTNYIRYLSGTSGQVKLTTDAAGTILTVEPYQEWEGFVIGSNYFIDLPDPAGSAVQGQVTMDSTTTYTKLVYNAFSGIVDFGNGLYTIAFPLTVSPPSPAVGTTIKPFTITNLGTPQYYTAQVTDALIELGITINC